jgi:biotin transport system substrate-specific component
VKKSIQASKKRRKKQMLIKKLSVRELCSIGLFTAIIAVCAQISIPMPYGVPMTLQTFAIPLAGAVLGIKNGTIAALVYVLLGAVGVPVFANFSGGIGMIFGRTGGFILAFPLMALLAGIGAKKDNPFWLTMWLVIGAVVLYISGMLMFSFVTSNSLMASFGFVVVPFLPTEVIKIAMVVVLNKLIKQALRKSGLLAQ